MDPSLSDLEATLTNWTHAGQALVATVGALAFVFAFLWKMTAVEPRSVMLAKQWIGRIVVGTIGVEMATTLVNILTHTVSNTHK